MTDVPTPEEVEETAEAVMQIMEEQAEDQSNIHLAIEYLRVALAPLGQSIQPREEFAGTVTDQLEAYPQVRTQYAKTTTAVLKLVERWAKDNV